MRELVALVLLPLDILILYVLSQALPAIGAVLGIALVLALGGLILYVLARRFA